RYARSRASIERSVVGGTSSPWIARYSSQRALARVTTGRASDMLPLAFKLTIMHNRCALSNCLGGGRGTMRGTVGSKIWIALSFVAVLLVGCDQSGRVRDEATRAGRKPESFPAAGEDYFKAMDNGASFTSDEVKGRNMWIVWTGGNDRF